MSYLKMLAIKVADALDIRTGDERDEEARHGARKVKVKWRVHE